MKKIVLGCAAVLLSLGLLAGCNDDDVDDKINNTGPEENEPTDDGDEGKTDTGPGPEEGGTPEKTDPVIGTVTEGEYWLGFTMGEVDYYFDGSLDGYYGSVTTDGWAAATVTVEAVTGGYTLSFTDENEATQYLYAYVSGGYVDLGIQTDSFTWQYDTAFDTFVVELNDRWNFIGTYGSYESLSMNDYGYLTGDTSTNNAQYPAKLFTPIDYSAPTSITLSGNTTVVAYELITLTATIQPDNADPSLIWSWTASGESNGEVTVYDSGMVLGVTAGTVTVTATSVADPEVSGSFDITVSEGSEPTKYKLGSEDTTNYCYYWFNGKTTTSSGSTFLAASTDWGDSVDVYLTKVDDVENNYALRFYNEDNEEKYITCTSNATSITLGDVPCTWVWNENNDDGYFSAAATAANGRFIGESASGDFRAYAASNLSSYPHVQPFTDKPEDPVRPTIDVTLEEVSSITSGNQYYLGALVDEGDYQFITGTVTSYKLPTVLNDLNSAAQVTVTGNDSDGWTLTINGSYIYAYVYSSNTLELGLSSDDTVPNSGVNVFSFDSTSPAFYTSEIKTGTYTSSYLEYYGGNVCLYGTNNVSTVTNAAHLYQVVED